MKRAMLALSAAILLLGSVPALADGNRSRHDGYRHDRHREHHARPSHRFESRHFRGHRRGYYVVPPYFGITIYPPRVAPRHYRNRDRSWFGHRGGHYYKWHRFKRHRFGGHRHRH